MVKKKLMLVLLCDQSIVLGEKERGVDGEFPGGLPGGLSGGGCTNGAEDEFDRSKDD